MADKLFEDDEFVTKRFSCSCLHPAHILDVSIEADEKGKWIYCLFEFCLGSVSWKTRFKQMWNILRGRESELEDFYLRTEDAGELVELLERVEVK